MAESRPAIAPRGLRADMPSRRSKRATQTDLRATLEHADQHDVVHPDGVDEQRDGAEGEEEAVDCGLAVFASTDAGRPRARGGAARADRLEPEPHPVPLIGAISRGVVTSGSRRLGRVASTDPARISTKPIAIPNVNDSLRTVTPSSAATAGLT